MTPVTVRAERRFLLPGETVTDPAVITEISQHVGRARTSPTCGFRGAWHRISARLWRATSTAESGRASIASGKSSTHARILT
jgi:hypothetical protein